MANGVQELPEPMLRHDQVALYLGNVDPRWVVEEIRAGEFGTEVVKGKKYFLVPVSAFNAYVRARRAFDESGRLKASAAGG